MAGQPVGDGAAQILLISGGYVPRKRADVLELDMEDGVVLYDSDASLVHHLNPSASVVWHLSQGDASVERLAGEIAEEYRLDPEETSDQVMASISELAALGLVEDARDGRETESHV